METFQFRLRFAIGLITAMLVAGSAMAADTIQPGLYKIAVTMHTPDGRQQTTESETCLTQEDVNRGPNPMPEDRGFDEAQCETVRYDFGGGKLDMEMRCSGPRGETVIVGTGQYDDDSFSMTNEMSISVPNLDVNMKMRTTSEGSRQDDC